MTSRLAGALSLLGTGLRGLRSRLLLTLGSILLAAISVGAAVVGPMYQSGAASSYLVAKMSTEPNFLTGLVFDYLPGSSDSYAQALVAARKKADAALSPDFGPASVALRSRPFGGFPGYRTEARLVSASGACDHLRITGRCPTKVGEVMILKQDSTFAPLGIGKTVKLKGVPGRLTVVGTYAPRPRDEEFWFNLRDLESVPPQPTATGMTPYRPAPLLVPPKTFGTLNGATWYVRATRRLTVTPQTTVAEIQRATRAVAAVEARAERHPELLQAGALMPEFGNALVSISQELQTRRATARSTLAPAVVSVILVALVLLLRLLAAAMDLRRSELALASLRGFSRRQMWVLGLLEPVIMLAIATPIGIVGGYLSAKTLADVWLVPGLPMPFSGASALASTGVVAATLIVAALVVRDSVSEPLSAQIAGVRRPGRSGRWGVLLGLLLVAAAVTILVATLASSKKSSPDATDLSLPILLAAAAGLVTTIAAQFLGRSWSRWTAGRRGVFSYLASRTISRRREGTMVILPLTAALAVAVFAAGVFGAAANWRSSDAATLVGADDSYSTQLTMDQAVALTHRIDPKGQWLMAIGAQYETTSETLVMDTPRLARVGVWPDSWTPGTSAAEVASDLSAHRQSVELVGSRISMTIDNSVTGAFTSLTVTLKVSTPDGITTSVLVGPFRPGRSTVSAPLPGCANGCLVKQMAFGGPAGLTGALHGEARITAFTVDGIAVPGALGESWRVAAPIGNAPDGVHEPPRANGAALVVQVDARDAEAVAAITPGDVPAVRPVIVGQSANLDVVRRVGDALRLQIGFSTIDVHVVAKTESMPVLGPAGVLIDYRMLTREASLNDASTFVTILARSDTPASVTAALADNGISRPQQLSAARGILDQDAFALALNLYLVVTVIVILLALAGLGANLAVQMPARRRDAASLRVVGLRRRSIIAAVIAEFVVVLGAAALAGVGAGSLSQYVVVRTVTLGYADTQHTPRLLPSLDLGNLTSLLALVTAVLLVVAVTVGALTVRGARTASLRENAR